MAGEPVVTIVGNCVNDPELRFLASGVAVASFTIASTPRTFDRQSNEWKEGETLFMRCSIWRDPAENVAESLTRGMRVIVNGRIKSRSYEKDGVKHTVIEMDVDEVGPSLRYANAKVTKTSRGGGSGDFGGGGFGGQQSDPWATGGSAPQGGSGPQEIHPVVEEAYVIAGALCGPHGTMNPGAYFWRPPGIAHGPFGSRTGSLSLIRFVGGRHVNEWTETAAPFDFATRYDPILPTDMALLAKAWPTPPAPW